jgi:hypothetical protein
MKSTVDLSFYKKDGIFIFDESQFTAAVEDFLATNIKSTAEHFDIKGLIEDQSEIMLKFLNNQIVKINDDYSVDMEMLDIEGPQQILISIVLKLSSRHKSSYLE